MKRLFTLNSILSYGIAICIMGCAKTGGREESNTRAIIGADNREPANDSDLEQAIGTLKYGENTCTAFASAANAITTAAHCIDLKAFDLAKLSFRTAAGTTVEIAGIKVAYTNKDLVVLSTKEPLHIFLNSASLGNETLTLAGVDPKSGKLVKDSTCKFEKRVEKAGIFVHSCDTVAGNSGSPILQSGRVIGIHLGYFESLDRNAAYETSLLNTDTTDVAELGITGEHFRIRIPNNRVHVDNPFEKKKIGVCGQAFLVSAVVYVSCVISASEMATACAAVPPSAMLTLPACVQMIKTTAGICGIVTSTLEAAVGICMANQVGISITKED